MKTNTFALRAVLLTAVWIAGTGPAEAQRAMKLKEINPSVNAASGFPNEFVEVGGVAVFSAVDASDDRELWVTDGTTEGTQRLKDINPGAASSNPTGLTLFGGAVYFSATSAVAGNELWRTDGTEAGTFLVKDIAPGVDGSSPLSLTVAGDRLYFTAYLAAYGRELWASDGTSVGTQMVKDALVGTVGISPSSMRGIGGVLYFAATTAASGKELWRSDGTAEGTFMVSDIVAGAGNSDPVPMKGLGNIAFFTAYTSASGRELWATDGTSAGTYQVSDILAGSQGALNSGGAAAEYDGYLYFQIQQASFAVDGLWRTDGTPAGTSRLLYLRTSGELTPLGGFLYFVGDAGGPRQLWRSDGTVGGTFAISSVPYNGVESSAHGLTVVDTTIFFFGSDQLWASNGAPGGAYLVKDILPGTANYSNMHLQRAALGRLFFSATDMVNGQELWISDGTTPGTMMLKDIRISPNSGSPASFTERNGTALFAATDVATGRELWKSDGTEAGTVLVKDLTPGSAGASPTKLTRSGSFVYFVGNVTTTSSALWRTDGTSAGTVVVANYQGTSTAGVPDKLTDVNGTLYFVAANGSSTGVELFKTSGGAATLVKDLRSFYGSSPNHLAPLGNELYFGATDNVGYKLFRTDGTAVGTVEATQGPEVFASATSLVNAGTRLYFSASDPSRGVELWTTDGTSGGTYLVADIHPTGSSSPANITMVGAEAYFTANDGVSGVELWKTDGTRAGTVQVTDLNPGPASSSPTGLLASGGLLYFTATDGLGPVTLWSTDGTPGGTTQVRDVSSGGTLIAPSSMADANGTLIFQATEGVTGAELWSTDGASGFAFQIHDINEGPASSSPSALKFAAGRLYFAANDGLHGSELWTLSNQSPVAFAGEDQAVDEGVSVTLSGSGSTDPDADALTFEWRNGNGDLLGRGVEISPVLESGEQTLTLIVRDGYGGLAMDDVIVAVSPRVDLSIEVSGVRDGSGGIAADANEICANPPGGALTCTHSYAVDSVAHLVATPAGDSVFGGWTGACASAGTALTCDVAMSEAASAGATFLGPYALTLEAASIENGIGAVFGSTGGGATAQCDAVAGVTTTCALQVRPGDLVLVGAMPQGLSILNSFEGCVADPVDPSGSGCAPFTMDGPQTIRTTFRGPQTLTIEAASFENGLGEVFASNGIDMNLACQGVAGTTSTCSIPVRIGDSISFFAMPGPLSVLNSITGCVADPFDPNGTGCFPPFVMTAPTTLSATFRGPQTLTIEAASFENGLGEVFASNGIDMNLACQGVAGTASTCSIPVRIGDSISFFAMPGALSVLNSITGCEADPFDPNGAGCFPPFLMTAPTTLSATFRGPQTLTIEAASFENGLGEVFASNGVEMNLSCQGVAGTTSTCTIPVRIGDSISFFAMPGALSVLNSITGCVADPFDPNGAGCFPPFTMNGPKTISATFQGPQSLGISFAGDGTGEVIVTSVGTCINAQTSCAFPLRVGTVQQIQAVPSGDSLFQSWGGACAGQGPVCSITINDDTNAQANFVLLNNPPVANAGGPYAGVRNQAVAFSGAASSDPDSDPLTYSWDFGDGSPVGSGVAPTHAYATTGTFTVTLTVNDGTVNSTAATATVTISNQAPTANAGGPYSGVRNQAVTLSGAASNDPDGDTLTYAWDFGDGSPAGTGVAPTHAYATTGTFTVTLTVNDGTANSTAATATVTISNQTPTANAGGPYSGVRNQAITFSGATSNDPDGDTLAYSWDFGDGSPTGTGVAPTHAYATTGTFTVTLTVNDGTANSAATTSTVTISNQAPTANAGGPHSGVRNQAITFNGAASNDPDGDTLTYSWDFGDGAPAGSGVAPTHAYATTGTFTVTLTVNDGTVNSTAATATVTISNQAPTANVGGPYSGVRNQTIAFSGSTSNDPDGDTLTYAWDFGDGSATETGVAPTHAYATTGTFTVTLTVNDGTVDSAAATATVTVSNQAPTANGGGPYSGVRNQAIMFSGAASNDPDGETLAYSWDFGDGSPTGTGVAPTHAYATAGTFTVTLTVNDGTVNSTPATSTVTITNQAPTASAGGPYSGVRNQAITFSGAASNDPDGDTLTYSWDFGDGSAAGTGVAPTHAYATTGTFTVTLTVNDGTINSTAATATVTITNQAPTPHAGGPYSGVRNQAIAFSGAASNDPDGDTLTYSWDFGDGSPASTGVAPTHAYATTGTFTVTLTVNDGTVDSAAATATVTVSNQAPTANAGGPYSGTRLVAIAFNGAASTDPDADALTYSWSFGDGGVGTGPSPTHLYTATGNFTVTLTVNDGVTTSAPATSTVTITNVAPTVALTSPGSGAVFHAPTSVVIAANAGDADGGVARVDFYAGAMKIGEALDAPYQILWPVTVPGAYTLTAVVTDSSGATVVSAPVNVVINAPPTVALTAPAHNAQYAAPANITLTATAADTDGTIAQVEFFRGTTSLGIDNSAPYTVTWTGAPAGSNEITAVATDNRGAVVTSSPITVKVTATLALIADSYVRASSSNSNFGTATEVTVQQGSSNSNIRWTYVKFDLTSIPTLTNAKVRLHGRVNSTTGTAINTAVYAVSDTSWTETGIKWNNKPVTGATALATVPIVTNSTTARWYEFDVTAHLQAEKAAGRNVVTLAFKNLANSSPYLRFTSRQGTTANRPQVVVVP